MYTCWHIRMKSFVSRSSIDLHSLTVWRTRLLSVKSRSRTGITGCKRNSHWNQSAAIGKNKLTSDLGPLLRFWAHKLLARRVLQHCRILTVGQFDLLAWESILAALHEVPWLFQLWACKQVLSIAATNDLRSKWTPNLSS